MLRCFPVDLVVLKRTSGREIWALPRKSDLGPHVQT